MSASLARIADLLARLVRQLEKQDLRGVGPCDVLTFEQGARLVGMRRSDFARWAESRRLVRSYDGRRRVIAGEVVAAHDDADTAPAPAPTASSTRASKRRAARAKEDRWASL